ncbi:HNH endonuclease [Enterococcus durans IPLA 655]|nr:hypothetical protein [Enterococcus durans]EMS75371.1 HNH endonuclease [Enterococcus durans IPLA 655]
MNPTLITKKELLKELDISTGVLADLMVLVSNLRQLFVETRIN